MKKAVVGQQVFCGEYKGVVETIKSDGRIVVLLHGTDGWPFPTRRLFTVKDLRRTPAKKESGGDYEEAPF